MRSILPPLLPALALLGACTKQPAPLAVAATPAAPAAPYSRVVIVGNSITLHRPKADIGWTGPARGMAASSPAADYVHLLTGYFTSAKPDAQVRIKNLAPFESGYWNYNAHELDTLAAFKPDLLIVRLGENVAEYAHGGSSFAPAYRHLVRQLAPDSTKTRVLLVGPFWQNPRMDSLQAAAAQQLGAQFVGEGQLGEVAGNRATGRYADAGVANHPSDQGMQQIADLIWKSLH